MFEHRSEPLADRRRFVRRQLGFMAGALAFVGMSLAIGMWGYMALGGLSAVDAFLNASMILSGMGPVDVLRNDAAKLFSGLYALYSGIALLTTMAILLAPLLHRMLHALNLDEGDGD